MWGGGVIYHSIKTIYLDSTPTGLPYRVLLTEELWLDVCKVDLHSKKLFGKIIVGNQRAHFMFRGKKVEWLAV